MYDAPVQDLGRVAQAQRRLVDAVSTLDDEATRRPSSLPGWTLAHVLAHIARNADSHLRRAEAAVRGEVVEQYRGGFEGRAREIEAGAAGSAAELVEDVVLTGERVMTTWQHLPASAWAFVSRDVGGTERPLRELPGRRWQELEVHVVDLQVGVTHRDWSADFVGAWLPRLRASRDGRMPSTAAIHGDLDERDELAWLYGRFQPEGWPVLTPWG